MRSLALSLMLAVGSAVYADVPPPPLAPQSSTTATQMARALETNDVRAYGQLLASNVEVWIDGRRVADNSAGWLHRYQPQLATPGVRYRVTNALAGNTNFVLVARYNSRGSFEVGHQECCEFYEVSQYEMSGGKIIRIRILTTGNHDLTNSLTRQ